jgi:hypothetical protein
MIIIDSAVHGSNENKSNTTSTGATSSSSTTKPGQKGASLEFSQTPKKYRRRPLTQDEIDLVTVNSSLIYSLH